MKKLILKIFKNKEIILYLIFGVLTTIVSFSTYMIFTRVVGLEPLVANGVSWVLSVFFAYVTNKLFVFSSKCKTVEKFAKEIIMFFISRLASGVFEMGIIFIFVSILHFNDLIIKAIATVLVIIINYFLSKLIIFVKK